MGLQALWLLRKGQHIHRLSSTHGARWGGVVSERGLDRNAGASKGGRGHPCRLRAAQLAELKKKAAKGQFRRVLNDGETILVPRVCKILHPYREQLCLDPRIETSRPFGEK